MIPRAPLRTLALLVILSGCGDDTLPQPVPEPDLIVSGRLVDDLGQPLEGGRIEGYLITIPSAALAPPASSAPSCENATVPSGPTPGDETDSAADGSFSLSIVGLNGPLCLILGVRESGQSPDATIVLPPRLVSPASTSPVTVAMGEIAIGQLDQAAE
jgi:hypothetical protein